MNTSKKSTWNFKKLYLQAIPSICIPIFSCASPFSAALSGFALGTLVLYLAFAGHPSTRYLRPPPICRSCSAGLSLNLQPHLRFDSQLSSSNARAARRLLVARTPVFSRVTRVANARSAALPDFSRHSWPRSSSRRRHALALLDSGSFPASRLSRILVPGPVVRHPSPRPGSCADLAASSRRLLLLLPPTAMSRLSCACSCFR